MATTKPAAPVFAGWPPEAIGWFTGLEADNSRAYFTATRDTYEAAVRAPLEALLAAAADEFGDAKVFRPHRDVRFSADKSPYKTQAAAYVPRAAGGWYVAISAAGLHAGAGLHAPSRDQLARYRSAVADDGAGAALEDVAAALAARDLPLQGAALKTAPRGYPRDHPRIGLLRRKDVTVMHHLPPGSDLHTSRAYDRVAEVWRAAAPLLDWLDAHVGAAQDEPRRVARRADG